MKKIVRLSFKYFRHLEMFGFCHQMMEHASAIDAVTHSEEFKAFKAALLAFEAALHFANEVSGTDLKNADSDVNKAWTCLITQARLMMNSRKPAVRATAQAFYEKLYRRKAPTRLSFDEQYAIIQRHLIDLEATPTATLASIHCEEWVEILREKFDRLMYLKQNFHSNNVNLGNGSVKTARDDVEFTYHEFCEYLMSLARLSPSDEVLALCDLFNEQIEAKRTTIKQRRATGKDDSDEENKETADSEEKQAKTKQRKASKKEAAEEVKDQPTEEPVETVESEPPEAE